MAGSLHKEESRKLVDWLKTKREEQRLAMREIATILGVPHSFVGKLERSERRLDGVEYVHYCRALGVSPIEGLTLIDPTLKPKVGKK